MNTDRRFWLAACVATLFLAIPLVGCHGPSKAISYASMRSRCASDKIKVVRQDGHDLVLDVCNVHENWAWHGFNGWQYVGPAAQQPIKPPPPPTDTDGDGIADPMDACPTVAGPANPDLTKHGCPPPTDADGDGIADPQDACPNVPGPANEDPKKNGCPPPPDADGDGVPDDVDACRDIPGIQTEDPATNGCPGDTDGDTFRDDEDACPKEAGEANENPSLHGCPKGAIVVTEKQVVINDRIEFATGLSVIRPVSNELLDNIAKVLTDHPELTKIEIQGHTDNQGGAAFNRRLSENRAKAVMKALVKRGVDASRMTAKGFGPDDPIAENDSEEGRQKNRRVQFEITEREKKEPTPEPGPAGPEVTPTTPAAPGPADTPKNP